MLRKLNFGHCVSLIGFALLVASMSMFAQEPIDSDHDGLPDSVEQSLLEKFRPTFMISSSDCAKRPARFQPGVLDPVPVATDGTIYGQVTPRPNSNRVEIHYYMLWEKDCGRLGHALDSEHVSALVTSEPDWKAVYWYAGAHEKTVCDISSGARATAIDAEDRGPQVWSSSGKHAIYLRRSMCGHGCGGDSCNDNRKLETTAPVVNLGEPGAPANGTIWAASRKWPLVEKMGSDFPDAVVARLSATSGETVLTLSEKNKPMRGAILGGDAALDGAATGVQQTGSALETANSKTGKSLGKATNATGNSLKRALKATFGWMKPRTTKETSQQRPAAE